MHRLIIAVAVVLAATALLTACGSADQADKKSTQQTGVAVTEVSTPSTLTVLTTKPTDAIDVTVARTKPPGSAVTVQGRIGGRSKPFIAERSAFLLADLKAIAGCDANPDDKCDTPWDFCCETTAKIAASTCLVQVVDSDGKVATIPLDGVAGMAPGRTVVVTGTLSPQSSPESAVIIAQGVYVEPLPAKK